MTNPLVSLSHARKSFGKTEVLKDISLSVEQGQVVAIIGPSGGGKSTLLRCMTLLETLDGGSLSYGDLAVATDGGSGSVYGGKSVLSQAKTRFGLVFQSFNLFPHYTVMKNITDAPLSVQKRPKDQVMAQAHELLVKMGLEGKENMVPCELSGGQQQRVALARMLAARPGILMLDEPFSALDAHLKSVLEQNLVSLFDAFRGTILYVSHDIDEALRFCDRIAVVESGHIMEMGTGDDLVNRPQSQAGIKLSGCKNATPAQRRGPHTVWLPKWGVQVETAAEVPEGVKCLGVRAFYLQRADGPGRNCFRMRVDRVSDSRFERTALLGFLDRSPEAAPAVERTEDEMKYLHQHLFWRVDKLKTDAELLPHEGEELWIHIPDDKLYLVER